MTKATTTRKKSATRTKRASSATARKAPARKAASEKRSAFSMPALRKLVGKRGEITAARANEIRELIK